MKFGSVAAVAIVAHATTASVTTTTRPLVEECVDIPLSQAGIPRELHDLFGPMLAMSEEQFEEAFLANEQAQSQAEERLKDTLSALEKLIKSDAFHSAQEEVAKAEINLQQVFMSLLEESFHGMPTTPEEREQLKKSEPFMIAMRAVEEANERLKMVIVKVVEEGGEASGVDIEQAAGEDSIPKPDQSVPIVQEADSDQEESN